MDFGNFFNIFSDIILANSSILSGMSRQKLNLEDLFAENLFQRIIYFICRAKTFISIRGRVRDVFQFETYECFIFIVKFNSFLSCNFLSWLITAPRQFLCKLNVKVCSL